MAKSRWILILCGVLAIFLGLSAIVHWVAFGGGDRNDCSGGISALGVGFSGIGLLLLPLVLLAVGLTKGKDAVTWLANRLRSKGAEDKPPPAP